MDSVVMDVMYGITDHASNSAKLTTTYLLSTHTSSDFVVGAIILTLQASPSIVLNLLRLIHSAHSLTWIHRLSLFCRLHSVHYMPVAILIDFPIRDRNRPIPTTYTNRDHSIATSYQIIWKTDPSEIPTPRSTTTAVVTSK